MFSLIRKHSTSLLALVMSVFLLFSMTACIFAEAPPAEPTDSVVDPVEEECSFSEKELFVAEKATAVPALTGTLPEGARFVSGSRSVASVQAATGVITGKKPGHTTLSLLLPQEDGTEVTLDTMEVYCFRPTTFTVKKNGTSKNDPAPYRLLNVSNSSSSYTTDRTYALYRQKFGINDDVNPRTYEKYGWLGEHGCSTVAVADICQGYGATQITPLWLYEEGLAVISEMNGVKASTFESKCPHTDEFNNTEGSPLGWTGMQNVLSYAGIPSRLGTWEEGDTVEAVTNITTALSEGRPVILCVYSNSWKDPRTGTNLKIASTYHFILLTGIDKDGFIMHSCGSSANVQTTNAYNSKTQVKITVSELLDHFIRYNKYPQRTKDSDFFYSVSGGSGSCVYLEVTEDHITSASIGSMAVPPVDISDKTVLLSEDTFVYDGEEHRPAVTVEGLEESAYTVTYENNRNAGTAYAVIEAGENYTGSIRVPFTIRKAAASISASGKTVTTSASAQSFVLSATHSAGLPVTYTSSAPKNVKVDAATGSVSVAKNYIGKATVTISSPGDENYAAASKKVTVTVRPKKAALSSVSSPKKKNLVVKWKKVEGVTGYEIQYAYRPEFVEGHVRNVEVPKQSTVSKTMDWLTSKGQCYVRIRSYKTVSGTKIYSAWSASKTVKIK